MNTISIPLHPSGFALIDVESMGIVAGHKWYRVVRGGASYAARYDGRSIVYLHREICRAPLGIIIDHANRDGLDNRKINLREADKSLNCANSGPRSNNTSGFKGVHFDKTRRKWTASIKAAGKGHHLGRFDSADEAAIAYDAAAVFHFGEFAHLNFPNCRKASGEAA